MNCPNCNREFRNGGSMASHTRTCGKSADLFWAKVDKSAGPDACWPYTGSITSWGYGHFNSKHVGEYMAHRFAWELANGRKAPAGFQTGTIMHTCDNPPCCNPKHLRLGTHLDNMQDKLRKGRNLSKLTLEQATEIKRQCITAPYLGINKDLAAKYGISASQVCSIRTGKRWAHIRITV